jgi:hypothetical protein
MIATAVFAVVLLIVVFGFLFVSNDYIKGYVQSQTQETARAIMEEVSQDVELNTGSVVSSPQSAADYDSSTENYICVGTNLYAFYLDDELNNTPPSPNPNNEQANVFDVYPNVGSCEPNANSVPCKAGFTVPCSFQNSLGGKELLANHMRLGNFSITPINSSGLFSINLTVAYGDTGVLGVNSSAVPYVYTCPDLSLGGNFCADSNLQEIVQQRVSSSGSTL